MSRKQPQMDRDSHGVHEVFELPDLASNRVRYAATLSFLAAFFFTEVAYNERPSFFLATFKIEKLVLVGLMLYVLVASRLSKPAFDRLLTAGTLISGLVFLQLPYFFAFHIDPIAGSTESYIAFFVAVWSTLATIPIFAFFFYDETMLIDVFSTFTKVTIIVALASMAAYYAWDSLWLLDLVRGHARPQAFLSEPSAFASILPSMLLISWRRRSYFWIAASLACLVVVQSPTVWMLTSLSLIVTFVLFSSYNPLKTGGTLIAALLLAGTAMLRFLPAPEQLVESGNGVVVALGRLLAGVEYVANSESDAKIAYANVRFDYAVDVVTFLAKHDLLWTGYGLASSNAYYGGIGVPVKDVSMALFTLFSYGLVGLAVLLGLMLWTLLQIRRLGSQYYIIYVPSMLAALLNPAQGIGLYKFVLLGILVYTVFPNRYSVRLASLTCRIQPGIGKFRAQRSTGYSGCLGTGGGDRIGNARSAPEDLSPTIKPERPSEQRPH